MWKLQNGPFDSVFLLDIAVQLGSVISVTSCINLLFIYIILKNVFYKNLYILYIKYKIYYIKSYSKEY